MNNASRIEYRSQIKAPTHAEYKHKRNYKTRYSRTTNHFHSQNIQRMTLHYRETKLSKSQTTHISSTTTDTVFLTDKFKNSIEKLSRYSSREEKQVGLIVRINSNDFLCETFWSEKYVVLNQRPLSLGFMREKNRNVVLTKNGYEISTTQPDLGGHCEEIFIRSWKRLIKYQECKPRVVDLVLTLSPCMSQSSLFLDDNQHLWPAGCAPKLYRFISMEKKIVQWNIIYLQKNSDHHSDAAIAKLNRHSKVKVFSCNLDNNASLTPASWTRIK